MPFDSKFDDVYKFGIKGAAEDAGAYAERVDEQIFNEGILERVFNQINKADVVVADMTGRNPNVFYEVGYAHALGKIVLLLTQHADDIPFDLKHHQHTVYEGSIETVKSALTKRLIWAINEAQTNRTGIGDPFEVSINDVMAVIDRSSDEPEVLRISRGPIHSVSLLIRNISLELSQPISHVYLFAKESSEFTLYRTIDGRRGFPTRPIKAHSSDSAEGWNWLFQLPAQIPSLPPKTFEALKFFISIKFTAPDEELKIRLHTSQRNYSYRFRFGSQATEE